MHLYKKDYKRLYLLQDKFLLWWAAQKQPFYLTGGTALGRFYLNHRFSEDLDFFVNTNADYKKYINEIFTRVSANFNVNTEMVVFSDDFTRFFIEEENTFLKIEFVNDISYRTGDVIHYRYGMIDTPLNILSNKLTALVSRDEAKDLYDIATIARNYRFNWIKIFQEAKMKAVINELDVEERLSNFPVEWLEKVDWLQKPVELDEFKFLLSIMADEFFQGKDNSLCAIEHSNIENAPLLIS